MSLQAKNINLYFTAGPSHYKNVKIWNYFAVWGFRKLLPFTKKILFQIYFKSQFQRMLGHEPE